MARQKKSDTPRLRRTKVYATIRAVIGGYEVRAPGVSQIVADVSEAGEVAADRVAHQIAALRKPVERQPDAS